MRRKINMHQDKRDLVLDPNSDLKNRSGSNDLETLYERPETGDDLDP